MGVTTVEELASQMVVLLPALGRAAYRLARDPVLAEDLVQEALTRALESREKALGTEGHEFNQQFALPLRDGCTQRMEHRSNAPSCKGGLIGDPIGDAMGPNPYLNPGFHCF
jgi:hypothetical protein